MYHECRQVTALFYHPRQDVSIANCTIHWTEVERGIKWTDVSISDALKNAGVDIQR